MSRRNIIIAAIAVLVFFGVIGAAAAWVIWGPNTQSISESRGVQIPPGSSFEAIVDSLDSSGVVASTTTFRWVARGTRWGDQIKAGYYEISPGASNYAMLNTLRRGLQSPIRLTIPPGTRPEIVARIAGRVMYFDEEDMLLALRNASLASDLGVDSTALFGFMLPESYDFYWLTPAETVVRRVKQHFDRFYEREIAAGAAERNLSPKDVVTMASIVEWETSINDEKPRVAGVYLNRLRINMPLQADPTVQYAILQNEGARRRLLFEDYRINHPYNTYQRQGLPPGPLNNPSLASIRSVVNAENHDFLYFVATGDGGHVFSRTFQEHVNAANRYRALMQERRRAQQQAEPAQ
jgi:UPF0755 protein